MKMNNSNQSKLHKSQLGLEHPTGYFEDMQQSLRNKLQQDLQGDDDLYKQQLGLTTPEAYFERSKKQLMTQIEVAKNKPKVSKFFTTWKLGIAASIAVLVLLGLGVSTYTKYTSVQNTLAKSLLDEADVSTMLVSSLFIEDKKFDAIIDDYLLEHLVLKSAVPIIESHDTTLESLFLDEQEVDDFLNDLTLETLPLENEESGE